MNEIAVHETHVTHVNTVWLIPDIRMFLAVVAIIQGRI